MSTQEIYNYIKVNDRLITGGQPTVEQVEAAAAEGFTAVINLALLDPRYALEDEAGLVRSLGMAYYHIPVEWQAPQVGDFEAFEGAMQSLSGDKVMLHCAANFRATAFYALYALKHLGWSEVQADEFMAPIWEGNDHPVWEAFLRRMKARLATHRE